MKEQIQAFLAKVRAALQVALIPIKSLWDAGKVYIIGFGVLVLIAKFRDAIIDYLVGKSKRTLENAQKEDAKLKADEDQANNQANKLIDDAKKLDGDKKPVSEDWYKNDK